MAEAERFSPAWLLARSEVVPWVDDETGERGECWVWIRATDAAGTPRAKNAKGNNVSVLRSIWASQQGSVPDGRAVEAKCQMLGCVKPSHLGFLG